MKRLLWILVLPAWALLAFVFIDSFGGYSESGNALALAAWMLFAIWAWWYGEDRDRRRAARAARRQTTNGDGR